MIEAIDHIFKYVGAITYAEYEVDAKTQDAVERRLQIVTEAAYRLDTEAEKLAPGPDWSDWRGLGNVLRHGYHKIDNQIIWQKVREELPALKQVALHALSQLPVD